MKSNTQTDYQYDMIIIGAGMAGLVAGAYLVREGFRVIICEQAEQTGGYFRTFQLQGFSFDAGLKAVENAGMLKPMIRDLGLDLKLLPSPCALVLPDAYVALKTPEDVTRFYRILGERFPNQKKGLDALLGQSGKVSAWVELLTTAPNPLFEDRKKVMKLMPGWAIRNLGTLLRSKRVQKLMDVPLDDFLSRYITEPALIRILTEIFFSGTPALFGLGYSQVFYDYLYPREGLQAITNALASYIKHKGGEILLNSRVKSIILDQDKASGVELESGESIQSRTVLSAGDMKSAYLDLLPGNVIDDSLRRRINSSEVAESAVCVFAGVDIPVQDIDLEGCGHIYIFPDYEGISLDEQSDPEFFARSPVEVSIPCLHDPGLAPKGKTGIIISALAKYDFDKGWGRDDGRYEQVKNKVADQLIAVTERIIPELGKRIIFRQAATPHTYERYTLNTQGAVCGWTYDRSRTFHQGKRGKILDVVKTPVPNLYQAGHWTMYPGGAPVAILTGRLASQGVIKRLKRNG
ncbi:NAD(P)/FAD-dependent oxidoreductase [candidate division WOR-3 bacterium]|nr:NAD(P)/FAD-dependent oxidoreductase [candidate division WOR-3 bacterium]